MIDFSSFKNVTIPEGEVALISRGSEILWQKVKYKRELEYLESTGTQYIDTGIRGTLDTAYTIALQATKSSASITSVVFGSRSSASSNNISTLFGAEIGDVWVQDFGNYSATRLQANTNSLMNKVEVHNSKNLRYVKDLETGEYTESKSVWSSSFTTPNNLLLGAKSDGFVAAMTNFCGRYYSCQITENDVLVRDFIPVLDVEDRPCMYDKVSGELFYNKGTGVFKYGELPRLPVEYQEVEYLESTGTQWIDTGVTINTATDDVEFIFQNTESAVYKWFFGEHDNNARFGLGSGDGANKRNVAYGNNTYKVADTQMYNTQHTFVANQSGVFIDGTKIANFASFASSSTLYLFNLNLSGGNYTAATKVWSFKQSRNGALIRDFIPVLDWNDRPCMYDKVTDELFYNQGTGEFLYGELES